MNTVVQYAAKYNSFLIAFVNIKFVNRWFELIFVIILNTKY